MDVIWEELTFGLPNSRMLIRILIRLLVATILGAIIGVQREHARKPAGVRTHILVCLGTAVFILSGSLMLIGPDAISRVIQGTVTGIGFIGAGSIIKLSDEPHVTGLTTAAGIWMTAAIGVAAGLGSHGVALLSTVFALVVLALAGPFEDRAKRKRAARLEAAE
jgi:putative Mg2+ transporter-C (MgtC) family protein